MPSDAEDEPLVERSPEEDGAESRRTMTPTEKDREKTACQPPVETTQPLDEQTVEHDSASAVVVRRQAPGFVQNIRGEDVLTRAQPTVTADWILVLNHPEYPQPYWASQSGRGNRLDEPAEPYWVYDHSKNEYEPAVRLPGSATATGPAVDAAEGEGYQGYNPKIHGSYDPNAPYAAYHNRKRAEEEAMEASGNPGAAGNPYAVVGSFNRFTGQFQTADVTAERHDDANKSARQMGAFFDVDAAANSHGGKSLKEERRNQKLTKKQIQEHKEKRQAKKLAKRKQWLMS